MHIARLQTRAVRCPYEESLYHLFTEMLSVVRFFVQCSLSYHNDVAFSYNIGSTIERTRCAVTFGNGRIRNVCLMKCSTRLLNISNHGAPQDTALGQFLVDNCFNPSLKCQNINCKRSARDHVLSFVHNDGRVDITVGWLPFDLPAAVAASAGARHAIVVFFGAVSEV